MRCGPRWFPTAPQVRRCGRSGIVTIRQPWRSEMGAARLVRCQYGLVDLQLCGLKSCSRPARRTRPRTSPSVCPWTQMLVRGFTAVDGRPPSRVLKRTRAGVRLFATGRSTVAPGCPSLLTVISASTRTWRWPRLCPWGTWRSPAGSLRSSWSQTPSALRTGLCPYIPSEARNRSSSGERATGPCGSWWRPHRNRRTHLHACCLPSPTDSRIKRAAVISRR